MEFLRFASSIPGTYWGCCAADVIQDFNQDPDAKSSIQIVSGDSGTSVGDRFAGPTYRDIFWQRLRYGTFGTSDMPNHAFFAIVSKTQVQSGVGQKWLAILHEAGFEFLRTVNNSVWNKDNYIFALIRNVGPNAVKDAFTPPKAWLDLGSNSVPEPWALIEDRPTVTANVAKAQKALYDKLPSGKFMTRKEVEAAGAPVILAGLRSRYPQQSADQRDNLKAADKNYTAQQPLVGGPALNPG